MEKPTQSQSRRSKTRQSPEPEYAELRRNSREWHAAWRHLAEASGDADKTAREPTSGECWQYTGSTNSSGKWRHVFRHRHHPRILDRIYLGFDPSPGWTPDAEKRKKRTLH